MSDSNPFDKGAAHQVFAADCFNRTWGLLDKGNRSAEDDEQMLLLCHASLWHWTQRDDCTELTLSVGYWQISRVYAVLEQVDNALRYAEKCLAVSASLPAFYQGFAHEALARAKSALGQADEAAQHLSTARLLAGQVSNVEERAMLEADLDSIQ